MAQVLRYRRKFLRGFMCSYMKHTVATLTRSCRLTVWSRRHPRKPSQHSWSKSKILCTRRGASCARRTLESYNAGVGREGLIWVWIVCGVGDLYPKRYTNARDIIMCFEKGCKGNLFCLITTYAVFTDSYVS